MNEKEPRFTKAQTNAMIREKLFPVNNMQLEDLNDIVVPEAAITFDASNNKLTDFTGFYPGDSLRKAIFDNNPIVSLRGFPEESHIKEFSAVGTPISELKNFRQLVLLAAGPQVKIINGEPVSPHEYYQIKPKTLGHFYFGTDANKMSEAQLQNIVYTISESIRSGWVSDSLPKSTKVAESEAADQENDPLAVRIVRLFTLLGKSDQEIKEFIGSLYEIPPPKKRPKYQAKPPEFDERLERQRNLILFMQDQLQDLLARHQEVLASVNASNPQEEYIPQLSQGSLKIYNKMLRKNAQTMRDNANELEEMENEKRQDPNYFEKDPEGIRDAVCEYFDLKKRPSDDKLIELLEKARYENRH